MFETQPAIAWLRFKPLEMCNPPDRGLWPKDCSDVELGQVGSPKPCVLVCLDVWAGEGEPNVLKFVRLLSWSFVCVFVWEL